MPAIAAKSSDWPFPATPAIPTISPAPMEKLMLCSSEAASASTSSTWHRGCRLREVAGRQAPTDHQLGEALRIGCRGVDCSDDAAGAHDADPVGDREDLLQLMGH